MDHGLTPPGPMRAVWDSSYFTPFTFDMKELLEQKYVLGPMLLLLAGKATSGSGLLLWWCCCVASSGRTCREGGGHKWHNI